MVVKCTQKKREQPVAVTLPVVVDTHPEARTLCAMVVELAIIEPRLAFANVGNIVPPILAVFATCLGEIERDQTYPEQ